MIGLVDLHEKLNHHAWPSVHTLEHYAPSSYADSAVRTHHPEDALRAHDVEFHGRGFRETSRGLLDGEVRVVSWPPYRAMDLL